MGVADRDHVYAEVASVIREARPRSHSGGGWWKGATIVIAVVVLGLMLYERMRTDGLSFASPDTADVDGCKWSEPVFGAYFQRALDGQKVLKEVNAYRAMNGAPPLHMNLLLNTAAEVESQRLVTRDRGTEVVGGLSFMGVDSVDIPAGSETYSARKSLVNVASGAPRSERYLVQWWSNCPFTRRAMLDREVREMGFGFAREKAMSVPGGSKHVWSVLWLASKQPECGSLPSIQDEVIVGAINRRFEEMSEQLGYRLVELENLRDRIETASDPAVKTALIDIYNEKRDGYNAIVNEGQGIRVVQELVIGHLNKRIAEFNTCMTGE